MLSRLSLTLIAIVGFVVLAGVAGAPAVAHENVSEDERVRIVDEDINITDATVTISDTHLTGPGLPDAEIDERRYTVEESTIKITAPHIDAFGKHIEICNLRIHIEDSGLVLRNVSTSS